jgi:hypothetical protein
MNDEDYSSLRGVDCVTRHANLGLPIPSGLRDFFWASLSSSSSSRSWNRGCRDRRDRVVGEWVLLCSRLGDAQK